MWIIKTLSQFQPSTVVSGLLFFCTSIFNFLFIGLILLLAIGAILGIGRLMH